MFAVNALMIFYVIVATFIIVIADYKQKNRHIGFLVVNVVIILWESIPLYTSIQSYGLHVVVDWSPLLLLPVLHRETEILASSFKPSYFDDALIGIEKKYFSYVMNFHQNNRANSLLLSEFLHVCYLSFFLLIYGVPLFFYLRHEYEAFYACQFVILFLLFSCYITHSIIPVCGPRTIFDKIKDHRSLGFFFRTTHKILQDGSTAGTAFPSGHTGVSSALLLTTCYLDSPLFYFILPFGLGLIASTVYGRFHYVTDMIFGFFYALIAFFVMLSLGSYLGLP